MSLHSESEESCPSPSLVQEDEQVEKKQQQQTSTTTTTTEEETTTIPNSNAEKQEQVEQVEQEQDNNKSTNHNEPPQATTETETETETEPTEKEYFCPFRNEGCLGKRFPAIVLVGHIFSSHQDDYNNGSVCCPLCLESNLEDSQSYDDIFTHLEDIHSHLFIGDIQTFSTETETEKLKTTTFIEERESEYNNYYERSPSSLKKEMRIIEGVVEDEFRAPSSSSRKPVSNQQCMLLTATGMITNYKRPRSFEDEGSSYSDESERDERVPQTKEEKLWEYFLQVDYSQSSFPVMYCSLCFKPISHQLLVDIFPCGHIFHGSKCNDSSLYCRLCKPNKQQKTAQSQSNVKSSFALEEPKAKKTPAQIRRAQTLS